MKKDFFKKIIICPKCTNHHLLFNLNNIVCEVCNEKYPIIYDIPVMITKEKCEKLKLNYYSDNVQDTILNSNDFKKNEFGVLKYIKNILIGTSGILYEDINEPKRYPLANIPFPKLNKTENHKLLEVGCGWGRWTINASQKGYDSIGIDKSLTSLIVAKKIAEELKIENCNFICCDVLDLPLVSNSFDRIYSFSFLQHFSKDNLSKILKNIENKMTVKSIFKTQMINKYSVRGIYNNYKIKYFKEHMIKEGRMDDDKDVNNFTVRYFSLKKIKQIFKNNFEIEKCENYSFFTQAQLSDFEMFSVKSKIFLVITIIVNTITKVLPFLKYLTDNFIFTLKKKI